VGAFVTLNDLLAAESLDKERILVLRHRPPETMLRQALRGLAVEQPQLFNAYQQTQGARVEKQMRRAQYVASFIGHEAGKALFVGLYEVGDNKTLDREEYWRIPEHIQLKERFGMRGFIPEREKRASILRFDLHLKEFYSSWRGKLIVKWPSPEIVWSRWAHGKGNEMPVLAILERSALERIMPRWDEITLSWEEIRLLPASWRSKLSEWRAIYYIFDVSDGKGYVGSACGKNNLEGRWQAYAVSGHGDNRLLRERDHKNFRFSILQRVSPDMDNEDVIRLEGSWKERLHTRAPLGLNDN
jgi:hypothetical protein